MRDLSASKAAHLEFGFGVLKVGGSGFRVSRLGFRGCVFFFLHRHLRKRV